ncbi:TetR/AcrR family transcriptional regulator [Leptospira gomenensis]|uniref:TetR/AcrR family transcriptional regulator n=1 Tax=Leptospira gomenensis TaxID=2484974 RepID=A0A5F1YKL8_9LEPT|nr:TetR/AcrR family transcriptional regulator [Leptospira gomenensis]TGK33293.1 TetR/AcrR family transcriptional regulator [Leptospira gomenensis]TGK45114.1 TetR/AcrR family transcriptional regulator [Leptospira gomenensis]TGK50899.1 TetR/AcrR family transcriptional regulator [Leptospira gomenensis]TGK56522.1 TetR/AcrR family transcriptional regulator [Leptospira gomenensis]
MTSKRPKQIKTKETGKSQQTRSLLFNTAVSLFQKEGYDETTMRKIAQKAGLAVGASYYHFKTKEEIVLEFYRLTQEEAYIQNLEFCKKENELKVRIRNIVRFKIEQFRGYEKFLHVLARSAGDPRHPLSPFSEETRTIREDAISLFRDAMDGCKESIPADLREILPYLFWLFQLGVIYVWLFDDSDSKNKAETLLERGCDLIFQLLRLSSLPLLRSVRKSLLSFIDLIKR